MVILHSIMTERVNFSDEETALIDSSAQTIAAGGEEAVWELVTAKIKLTYLSYLTGGKPMKVEFGGRIIEFNKDQIKHEVEIIAAVADRAMTILRTEGKDDASIIDKCAREAGLGSIFDPETEIGRHMKDVLSW